MDSRPNSEETAPEIKFNIDDFDLDNYEFEPLTEGLGFNNQNRKKENIIVKKREEVQPTPAPKPVLRKEDFERRETSISTKGLSSFYQDSKLEEHANKNKVSIKPSPRKKKFQPAMVEAAMELRLVAWIADVVMVSLLYCLTITAAAMIVSIPIERETLSLLSADIYLYLGVIYTCFYLFYFTVFDLQRTFGKYLMGIRTCGLNNEVISIKQSFIRSSIGLSSIILFGFPLLFDFQGKLSDTKVCTN